MKPLKSLMFMAAAAIAFASCTSDDAVVEDNSSADRGIVFVAQVPQITDTRVDISTDGSRLVPLWGPGDYIQIPFQTPNGQYFALCHRCDANKHDASVTAAFELPADYHEQIKNSPEIYAMSNGASDMKVSMPAVNRAGEEMQELDTDIYLDFNRYTKVYASRTHIGINDYMVTPVMKTADIDFTKPVDLKFKRLSGVVRMTLTDEDGMLNGQEIYTIGIGGMGGTLIYDLKTDKFREKIPVGSRVALTPYEVNLSDLHYKAGDAPFYFACMPKTFVEGEQVTFVIETSKHGVYRKTVTLGAEGLKFESGKVTTLRIDLSNCETVETPIEDPVPDPAIDPEISGSVITMKQPGRLTSAMVAQAIGSGVSVKICGDVNAFDMNSLRTVCKGDYPVSAAKFSVDLSEANIKADDKAVYIDILNNRCKISEDNVLPRWIITNYYKVNELILPESVIKLYYASVQATELSALTIGSNVTEMEGSAVQFQGANLKLTIKAGPDVLTNFPEGFTYNTSLIDLYLNKAWLNAEDYQCPNVENNTWNNCTWKSLTLID